MKRFLSALLALTIVFSMLSGFASADTTVYITKTGEKYHNSWCSHLSRSKISISLTDAINRGFKPCSDCHAPSSAPAPTSAHTHSWNSGQVTSAPTCSQAGVRTYTCTGCGQTKTESIPATGEHTWNSGQITTEATCAQMGVRTYTCIGCGKTKMEAIPANPNAHVWKCIEIINKPIDDQHGFGTFACEICNKTKSGEICPSSVFADVKNDWSHKGIDYAVNKGITKGMDATHFSPDAICTRSQVVTFLWRAAGCPEPKSTKTDFTDVGEKDFYAKAVAWAVEKGITNGISPTSFAPDATCTRGQIVTFLWRFWESPIPTSTSTKFNDVSPNAFYAQSVAWAVEFDVTKGMTDTTFAPDVSCTRGQIVTFLYRSMK